ncbi:FixH family protein [Ectobacillus ponti]|uniref:FixH family protein n=1 Tax=Ectobacillus ponti TaxID=2961894 RepID=A0AA41X8S7_9BACI|nr:FixH family protein [Ectobacillus ponti]MCP8971009.1 FixH family protein [Ectobacillus ponti]
MKRLSMVLLLGMLLVGCGKEDYKISVSKSPFFKQGTAVPFVIAVEKDGKKAESLDITGHLEMVKMDHGEIPVTFQETAAGTYESKVTLPMEGEWECVVDIGKSEQVVKLKVEKQDAVAKVGKELVKQQELSFYEVLAQLQQTKADHNQLLTHMIGLKSMALLAKEKGYSVSEAKVQEKLAAGKKSYNLAVIQQFGEEKFWKLEQQRIEEALLADQVMDDLYKQEKQKSPKAGEQEWKFNAAKAYEELLESQVGAIKVEIY